MRALATSNTVQYMKHQLQKSHILKLFPSFFPSSKHMTQWRHSLPRRRLLRDGLRRRVPERPAVLRSRPPLPVKRYIAISLLLTPKQHEHNLTRHQTWQQRDRGVLRRCGCGLQRRWRLLLPLDMRRVSENTVVPKPQDRKL